MAYSFTPLALPNVISALLGLLMLYLLYRFGTRNSTNRVLMAYVFFGTLACLTWALMDLSVDMRTMQAWQVVNVISEVAIFPLQIHFLLLFMEKGRSLTSHRYGPAALYTFALVHILFGATALSNLFFMIWMVALAVTMAVSVGSWRRERNQILKAQKRVILLFLVIPFVWIVLFAFGGAVTGHDFTWTAGFFMSASSAIALYAMLRHQLLNMEIFYRSGLVIFITSIIIGVTFLVVLRVIGALFGIRTSAGESLLTFFVVIVIAWFFKPLYDAGTRLMEWMAPDLKWKECKLEQVFLMYHTGLRIASAQSKDMGIDADLAGSMLTAVQEFVKDTFRAEKGDAIKTINMGQFKLLVEHEPPIYMAIVFTGDETPELRHDVRELMKKVLAKHGKKLEQWNGDRAGLEDTAQMLQGLFGKGSTKPG